MIKKTLFLSILLFSSLSWSLVDMDTKEYSNKWFDLKEFNETRKYSVNFNGAFGYNWCSIFDYKPKCKDLNLHADWKQKVKDNKVVSLYSKKQNRVIELVYNKQGLISSIKENDKILSYFKYNNSNQLYQVTNEWDSNYIYEYNEKNLLTKTHWPDKSFIEITYNDKNEVVSFKDRDNCLEVYTYIGSKSKNNLLSLKENQYTSKNLKICDKTVVSDNQYDFWESYNKKLKKNTVTKIKFREGKSLSERTFDENENPITITRNGEKTFYTYDKKGKIKTKQTSQLLLTYYFNKNGFLDKVEYKSIGNLKTYEVSFVYNDENQVVQAFDSEKQKVHITYNNKNQIRSLINQDGLNVVIDYDEQFGKPSMVELKGEGLIKVSYKQDGSIEQVISPQGNKVSKKVSSVFNNLLSLVSLANQNLY